MDYISHPFVVPETMQKRTYQFSISMNALEGNTLVVIPTGLGKTAIALIVAASRLYQNGGKVLMMAPTKPLVEQHLRYFQTHLAIPGDDNTKFAMFTGEASPDKRTQEWMAASVILATPQVIKNDIITGRYDLSDVSLLIVDEGHRAVGNYAYVFLADRYIQTAKEPLILAMTASPGGNKEKIADIVENLHIKSIETRTENDPDVKPYVHEKEVEIIHVDLPAELKIALEDLKAFVRDRLNQLKQAGFPVIDQSSLSMKALQEISAIIQQRIAERDASGFAAASIHAELMKLRHAIGLAESQGCMVLKAYLNKLLAEGNAPGGSKASKRIAYDPRFMRLLNRSIEWKEECHPKLLILPDLVQSILEESPETRIIIFATYRDTVKMIVDTLQATGISAERFVGKANKDQEKGLSQKRQIATISRFREGEFSVLVATSVGEEGLDIPSTDVVIFYEPVPSEIRSIQRKGRTGRHSTGRIIVLVTRKTADETFQIVSRRREKAMATGMKNIVGHEKKILQTALPLDQEELQKAKETQEEYFSGPKIIIDDRELVSKVAEYLSSAGAVIRIERLFQGDYKIGDRILVERKTSRDFVDSLIDRDLLDQLRDMARVCPKPVLIIEGGDIYAQRDIHPNAIKGALAAISVSMGITIFQTRDPGDTADLLLVLARREEENGFTERGSSQKETYESLASAQEAIMSAFPDLGPKYARALLTAFGSLKAIIDAEKEDLLHIPGIGAKKAEMIYELSRRPYP
ncbi:DEAD/DEAH box helicase [Methanospirillum sp.]